MALAILETGGFLRYYIVQIKKYVLFFPDPKGSNIYRLYKHKNPFLVPIRDKKGY